MNRLASNIPNRIKQPSKCCVYCGKSYVKKTSLDKHTIICELLNNSKNTTTVENEEHSVVPSQKKIYQILLELGHKFNKLEEKVDDLNKWVVKKKKKINVIEWLNANITPEIKFDNLIEKIIIIQDDVTYLFQNSFSDTLNEIFSRNIYNLSENEYPIFAFIQKANIFYIYENEEARWAELSKEKIIKFLNRVHMKLLHEFREYKKMNIDKIHQEEAFALLCDKTSVKMMNVDFRQESILGKIKGNMYSRMKTDMKALVEYEFEF
jgi:uncharacterized protein YeeX (DUF496 family)